MRSSLAGATDNFLSPALFGQPRAKTSSLTNPQIIYYSSLALPILRQAIFRKQIYTYPGVLLHYHEKKKGKKGKNARVFR